MNSKSRICVAAIDKLWDIGIVKPLAKRLTMFLQPRKIFIDLRCVDNKQKLLFTGPVEDEIIDYSTPLIQH